MDRAAEPSMEDILASIRRIITDDTPPLPAGNGDAPQPEPFRPMAAETLDLTEPMAEAANPEPIVSNSAASASAQSLSALSALVVRDYEGSDRTLEGVVRDMLKPMLREWLDANLPEVVERLVAREVKRITGRD